MLGAYLATVSGRHKKVHALFALSVTAPTGERKRRRFERLSAPYTVKKQRDRALKRRRGRRADRATTRPTAGA